MLALVALDFSELKVKLIRFPATQLLVCLLALVFDMFTRSVVFVSGCYLLVLLRIAELLQ